METVRPIKINLLETDQQSERSQFIKMTSLIIVIAILGLMGGIYTITLRQLHAEQAVNDNLKARYEHYLKSEGIYQAQMESLEGVRKRERMIETMEKSRVSYLDLMAEVEKAAPEGVILYNLDMQMNNIVITGRAGDENQVAILLAGLRASPWFKNVKTVSITNEGKDVDGLLRFDIQYEWEVAQK